MEQRECLQKFDRKYCSFNKKYESDFDTFWRWKIHVESDNAHILDKMHFNETFHKLSRVLSGWQYARGADAESDVWNNLKDSLWKISSEYAELRQFSLLDLENIDIRLLEKIWNQMCSIKEYHNQPTDTPLIMSIGKPLMLLWGQTTALDSKVRKNLYNEYSLTFFNVNRWTFKQWLGSLYLNYKFLKENSYFIDVIDKKSLEKYGVTQPVPYGRFLDIYYF